ncbi:MAG: phosphodiester glycosidase family protein [Candidatus Levybacteria bacterium]|nr:phosphodiester glycosidase family protein [Candidatus Levybacteria bacterium]
MFDRIPNIKKLNINSLSFSPNIKPPYILLIASIVIGALVFFSLQQSSLNKKLQATNEKVQKELNQLKSEDQYKKNKELEATIASIEKTYDQAVGLYEKIIDAKDAKRNVSEYEKRFAASLSLLSKRNYASAGAQFSQLSAKIDREAPAAPTSSNIAASAANVAVNNTAPGSGYSRQKVKTDFGEFVVDIVAADLNSTRVIVDTASDGDCRDNCPVLSLGDYVGRSGAFAGVNGSYFCPASYPSCVGKANSFDTLLMNKNKKYFNSDNNVYSNVPAVIFSGNSARFVGASSQWGRDSGVDSVLANQPLLVSGGNVVYGGDDEVKRAGAGSRSFVGSTGSTAYIGVVHGVNAAQMARVLNTLGIQNALNLDSGGSTALWSGGYKVGPGRNIPNALLFVRK